MLLVACSAENRAAASDPSLGDDERLTRSDVCDAVADSLASASDEVRSVWEAWNEQRGHPALATAQMKFRERSEALAQVTERTRRTRLSHQTRRSDSMVERDQRLEEDNAFALETLRRCVESIDARLALIEGQLSCLRAGSERSSSHTSEGTECVAHTPPERSTRPSAVSDAVVRRAARRLPQSRTQMPEWLLRMRAIGHHLHLTRHSATAESVN